jgi:hypothetical protein
MRNTKKDSQPYTGASTTSVPTCAAQVRVITMSARTSWRCCNTSRVSRISQHLTLTADPGETSKSLPKLGHIAGRVEGAAHSADRAPAYSGCEVLVAGILKLDLPDNYFDGVFADAALFHVSSQELPHMLLDPHASLKPGGALFSSNLHGHYEEGWNGGRYDVYYDLAPLCIDCRVR